MFYLDPCPPFVSCFASSGAHKRRSYVLEEPPDEEEDMPEIGDVKTSLAEPTAGWYKLNGQTVTDPGPVAAATSLFGSATLPDYTDRYLTQGVPGTTFGSNSVALSQDNLPVVDLPLDVHGYTDVRIGIVPAENAGAGAIYGGSNVNDTYVYLNQCHTSLNSSGTQTDLSIVPATVAVNFLVWLGS